MKGSASVPCVALMLVLALGGCGSATPQVGDPSADQEAISDADASGSSDQVTSPFVEVDSIDELADMAGFDVSFPAQIEDVGEPVSISVIPGSLAQAFYQRGDQYIMIRKGTDDGQDIAGDYEASYEVAETVDVNGAAVTLRGDDPNEYEVALWVRDGYSFAIDVDEELTREQMMALVEQVN